MKDREKSREGNIAELKKVERFKKYRNPRRGQDLTRRPHQK